VQIGLCSRGWVTLRLNIRLKRLRIPPTSIHRYIEEWFYYNFAAGSFYTTKLCSRLYSIKLEFYLQKMTNSLFKPPFGGVRCNVRNSSVARWKAHG